MIESAPRSRRAILVGASSAIAGAIAATLARAAPVSADSEAVVTGGTYTVTADTSFWNSTNTEPVLHGESTTGRAVWGVTGSGVGVAGHSLSGVAVYGDSQSGTAVVADSFTNTGYGLIARSLGGSTGVLGMSFNQGAPIAPAKTGVYGWCPQNDTAATGILGYATAGTGVKGTSSSGEGVHGESSGSNGTSGTSASGIASGVYGHNTAGGFGTYGRSQAVTGVGVFGESTNGTGVKGSSVTGTALEADGRVRFSTAGLRSVAVGSSSLTVTPGTEMVGSTAILCTLESDQGGLAIQRVTKDITAGTFKVFLNGPRLSGKKAKIAWFVIG